LAADVHLSERGMDFDCRRMISPRSAPSQNAVDANGDQMLSFLGDALVTFRELRESYRFGPAMVVILATGIVAVTVIFGLLEGVLLRQLLFPVPWS